MEEVADERPQGDRLLAVGRAAGDAGARRWQPYGPLQYHGKIPQRERQPILDRFKSDPTSTSS